MYIKELTMQEFNDFRNAFNDKSIYQTYEYGFVMNNQGYNTLYLGLIDNNRVVAATLILITKIHKFKYAYAPRGFILDYNNQFLLENFTIEIKKYLSKKEIVAIKLSPMIIKNIYNSKGQMIKTNQNYGNIFRTFNNLKYYHYGYNDFFESQSPRFEAVLPLTNSIPELFKNIKKEFRTKIRTADKHGIEIFKGSKDELKYLHNHISKKYPKTEDYLNYIYDTFSKTNKFDYYYAKINTKTYLQVIKQEYENAQKANEEINKHLLKNRDKNSSKLISRKINSDKLFDNMKNKLIKATNLLKNHPEGIVLASIIIIKDNDTINLFIDGFNSKFKSFNAKHLLLWKIIEKYSKLNYKYFNLGGITNINIKNPKYDGLNEFKLSFNSNVIEYIGDLELVTNSTLYFMYNKSLQIKNILKK